MTSEERQRLEELSRAYFDDESASISVAEMTELVGLQRKHIAENERLCAENSEKLRAAGGGDLADTFDALNKSIAKIGHTEPDKAVREPDRFDKVAKEWYRQMAPAHPEKIGNLAALLRKRLQPTRPALDRLCSGVLAALDIDNRTESEPITEAVIITAIESACWAHKITVDRPVEPKWIIHPATGCRTYHCSVCDNKGHLFPTSPLPSSCLSCGMRPTNAGNGAPT